LQAGYTLATAGSPHFTSPVITAVWAVETGLYNVSVPPANYSVTSAGILKNTTTITQANVSVSYTYAYTPLSIAYNGTSDSDTAVAKIPKSLKLLATAIIFGAVLWVIMRVIPMGKRREELAQ